MNESEAPPVEQLAALAGRWAPLLADPAALEAGFRTHQFGRLVELVRSQLGPLQSREALAESYLREAGRHRALEAAYVLRWLEMGDETPWDDRAAITRNRPWLQLVGAG